MGEQNAELTGPDFEQGVPFANLADGVPVLGHAQGERVVLVRRGDEAFAIGAYCTHYSGHLAEGVVLKDTIRCPRHHACFSLRTGEALAAPALSSVSCFRVERQGEKVCVTGKVNLVPTLRGRSRDPSAVVIVGGGAAAQAAAEMLRRRHYVGSITMLSADHSHPYDRPNLSKDYLAGNAAEEWIPLRPPEFFQEEQIDVRLGARVNKLDTKGRTVTTEDGQTFSFDALLLATGAEAIKLTVPGADLPHVHNLRSLDDSRAIIRKASESKCAVVVGASFIGLETAASLRKRGLEVHVVAPDSRPLERTMGAQIGDFVRGLHEEHGVVFHLGHTVRSIAPDTVTLANGKTISADLVVAGIGVKPVIRLAEDAGLALERGVQVNEYLETSEQGIFAAGDIARWPDPHTGSSIRVEHWAVAERHGQIAARNMLGEKIRCDFVPFFWSEHYDVTISYVGHAERWNRIDISGSLAQRDCTVAFRTDDKILAVATIGRDRQSLQAEVAYETRNLDALWALVK